MTGALLEAGLLPVGAAVEGADPVRPRSYRHPQLGDRPVVRLVGDTVAPGEDQALAFLGFGEPATPAEPVALGRPKSLGYPAWALVNDPAGARAALDAVPALERAARLARTKPGAALDMFETVAMGLPVSHLPSFWEQAGRSYLMAGNTRQATTMFGRARQAEQMHALPVDEETRRAAYLEFAFAGALSVKAISAYAEELKARYEPKRVYAEFMELVIRRSRGGLPPWAEVPRQVRALASAAGLDPQTEEDRLIEQVLHLPAARQLSSGVWKAWRAPLARLAAESPELRAALLTLFPEPGEVRAWWIGFLDELGALEPLLPGAAPGQLAPADWLTRAVRYLNAQMGVHDTRDGLLSLIERMSPRLIADRTPVQLAVGNQYWGRIDADLLDACLAFGVPVAGPGAKAQIFLNGWLDRGASRRDLAALAADERFCDLLDQAVNNIAVRHGLAELLAVAALRPRIERLLAAEIDGVQRGGLLQAKEAMDRLTGLTDTQVFDALPGYRESVEAVDVAGPLARTLRAGIIDEFGWPALTEAVEQLGGPEGLTMSASWPVLTVCSRTKAIAVGPAGRVAEHDLKIIASQVQHGPTATYVGGVFRVEWFAENKLSAYWSDAPSSVVTRGSWFRHGWGGLGFALLTPDGTLVSNGAILRPGDEEAVNPEDTLHDGATYWKRDSGVKSGFREFDPVTGALGRASLPEFFEDRPLTDGERWEERGCSLAPLPEGVVSSPLGHAGGLVGFRVSTLAPASRRDFRIEGVDGRAAQGTIRGSFHMAPWGLIRFPGATEDRLVAGVGGAVQLSDADGAATHWRFEVGPPIGGGPFGFNQSDPAERAVGTPLLPPAAFWHFLQARDEEGSRSLRTITEESARELLAVGMEAWSAKDPQMLLDAVGVRLPLITDERMLAGVCQAVMMAVHTELKRARLLEREPARPKPQPGDDAAAVAALHDLMDHQGGYWGTTPLLEQISLVGAYLTGTPVPDVERLSGSCDWTLLIGRVAAVAVRLAAAATPAADREALTRFLEVWAASPFADPGARWRVGQVESANKAVRDENGAAVAVTELYYWSGGATRGSHTFVELRTGEAAAPTLGQIIDVTEPPKGWGTAAQLHRLLELVREKGPVTWDPQAAETLAMATGMSRATACLTLAGFAGPSRYVQGGPPPMTAIREALGLRSKEAEVASAQLRQMSTRDRLDVLATALPEDLSELWQPDGMTRMAERVAESWVGKYGRRITIPESTLALADKLPTRTAATDICTLLAEPTAEVALTADSGTYLTEEDNWTQLGPVPEAGRLAKSVTELALGIAWAYAELPVGDPVQAGASAALELIRKRLAHPGVLLPAGYLYGDPNSVEPVLARFGTVPYRSKSGRIDDFVDDGLTVAGGRHGVWFYFRPAVYGADERSRLLETVAGGGFDTLAAAVLLRSEGYSAIVERIRTSGLPDGAYEANPATAVPGLVDAVADTVGLGLESAALYLQLLSLLEPTDRNVRMWNGWTAACHKKALAPLVERRLVVEAKRARAGRSAFLPGGWMEAKAPNLPVEAWKTGMYGLSLAAGGRQLAGPLPRFLPLRPLPELFAEAWQRIQNGDAPQ